MDNNNVADPLCVVAADNFTLSLYILRRRVAKSDPTMPAILRL